MKKTNIDSIIIILFYLYLIFLPLQDIKIALLNTEKLIVADIIFIPLFLLWALKLFFKKTKIPSVNQGIFYAIALLLFTFSLTTLFSKNCLRSSIDLLGLIYLISLFFISVSILNDKKIIYNSIKLWAATGISVIFIGFFAFSISILSGNHDSNSFIMYDAIKQSIIPFPRINSVFETQEMLISYTTMTLAFLFILSYQRSLWLAGIPITILGASLAFSRGLIGFMATWILCVHFAKDNAVKKFIFTLSIIVFLLLSVSIYASSKWILFPFNFEIDNQAELAKISFGISPGQREIINATAIKMWQDNFLLGVGPGEFTNQFKVYVDFDKYKNSWAALGKISEVDPHSTYYGALAETGILGLASMILLYAIILFQSAMHCNDKQTALLLASLAGLLLNGFICDIIMFRHLWLLFGFLCAAQQLNGQAKLNDDN